MAYKRLGRQGKITIKPRAWWGYMNKWVEGVKNGYTNIALVFYGISPEGGSPV